MIVIIGRSLVETAGFVHTTSRFNKNEWVIIYNMFDNV